MANNKFKQLVIVCRDYHINWNQFINPIFIGVESGILSLLKNKKNITFICGDNDSITKQQLDFINKQSNNQALESIIFSQEKDYLDSELAIIMALERKIDFQQLVIVADGQRWDMFMASINLLRKYEQYNPILVGLNNYCFLLTPNQKYLFSDWQLKYHYISFFSLTNEEVIYNFRGCKYYDNEDITISSNFIQAISNEFKINKMPPQILIKKGTCLVMLHYNQST